MMRLGAFAAVFLLSTGLLVTLFDEARAAEIQVTDIGTVSGGAATIDIDIIVPADQRMPLEKISTAIETRTPGEETKTSNSDVSLVTVSSCNSIISGCTAAQITVEEGDSGILTGVEFIGAQANGAPISDGYFGIGDLDWTHDGGYGYHPVAGYGYGTLTPGADEDEGNNFGYGYSGADLTLRFRFTISPNALGSGSYWFTALADTGSNTHGPLSSPAKPFTVTTAGGGGMGHVPTIPPPPGIDHVVDAIGIDLPERAIEAWRSIGTGKAGDTIRINTPSDQVPHVDLTLENDVTDAEIDIVVWSRDNFPPGVDAPTFMGRVSPFVPDGVHIAVVVQVTISDGSTGNQITVWVQINEADMEGNNPGQAFSAKHRNPWDPIGKVDLEHNETGERWEGSFSSTCCSTFLVGFDGDDPTVSLSADVNSVLEGETITFTAQADDNVEIDRVEFYLGDDLMHTATSAPFTWEWTPTNANIGTHTVNARAYDLVGNSAQDDESVQVQEDDTTQTQPDPRDETPFPLWIVILLAALVVIGGAVWYFTNQRKGAN